LCIKLVIYSELFHHSRSIFLRKWNTYLGLRKYQSINQAINPSQFSKRVAHYFHVQRPPDRIPTADVVIFFILLDECKCFNVNKTRCCQFITINLQRQARCAASAFNSSRSTDLGARYSRQCI